MTRPIRSFLIVAGLAFGSGALGATGYASVSANGDQSALNGVYRISWTEPQLVAAGATPTYAHDNLGSTRGRPLVITMKLRDGQMTQSWSTPPGCLGTYTVSGAAVSVRELHHCQGVFTASWSLGNGQLRLRITRATDAGDKILFGGKPWTKVG